MTDREELFLQLGELDRTLMELLRKRMDLAYRLSDHRLDRSLIIGDEERENALLMTALEAGGEDIQEIYRAIIRCEHQHESDTFGIAPQRIIDITRELLSSEVYPGDPEPELIRLKSLADGGSSNLSALSMCVHNSTHLDSPLHFIDGADDITQMDIENTVGRCLVIDCIADVTEEDISSLPEGTERLLIRGGVYLTPDGARAAAQSGLRLVGVEPQSVAPRETSSEVHRTLLGAGITILEGLSLYHVCEGEYTLLAQPLKIAGSEGSPCRALLLRD